MKSKTNFDKLVSIIANSNDPIPWKDNKFNKALKKLKKTKKEKNRHLRGFE